MLHLRIECSTFLHCADWIILFRCPADFDMALAGAERSMLTVIIVMEQTNQFNESHAHNHAHSFTLSLTPYPTLTLQTYKFCIWFSTLWVCRWTNTYYFFVFQHSVRKVLKLHFKYKYLFGVFHTLDQKLWITLANDLLHIHPAIEAEAEEVVETVQSKLQIIIVSDLQIQKFFKNSKPSLHSPSVFLSIGVNTHNRVGNIRSAALIQNHTPYWKWVHWNAEAFRWVRRV